MIGLTLLAGWVGLITGSYIEEQKHKEQVVRREFNNVDLSKGTHTKEVHYYLRGQELE